jgi:phosphoglycerol transferase MdoB-like AlkP superfamily enzyme
MKYLRSRSALAGVGLLIADLVFFGITDPKEIEPIFLIFGFGLLLVNVYYLLFALQKAVGVYVPAIAKQRNLRFGVLSCLGVLLALQSIGQLSGRDLVLVPLATLVLLAYFSYSKSSFLKPTH